MKRETARELLLPYLDGELDGPTTALLERFLATDPALRAELGQLRELSGVIAASERLEPDAAMRERFDHFLAGAQAGLPGPDLRPAGGLLPWSGLALFWRGTVAAALVLAGLGLGWGLAHRGPVDGHNVAEVEALRRDVTLLRALVMRGPFAQQSASYRLQTMSFASELETPDPEILDVLLATLEGDENPNVRIAALEALARFKTDPFVRQQLAAALPGQTDPLVQITLIRVLAESGAPEARETIEMLLLRPDVPAVVKGQAQMSLTTL